MEEEVKEKQPEKKKNYLLLFLKKNKIKTLLLLFLALAANTYAWFIYNRVVSANLEAHVKSWQVTIDGAVNENITFESGKNCVLKDGLVYFMIDDNVYYLI